MTADQQAQRANPTFTVGHHAFTPTPQSHPLLHRANEQMLKGNLFLADALVALWRREAGR